MTLKTTSTEEDRCLTDVYGMSVRASLDDKLKMSQGQNTGQEMQAPWNAVSGLGRSLMIRVCEEVVFPVAGNSQEVADQVGML